MSESQPAASIALTKTQEFDFELKYYIGGTYPDGTDDDYTEITEYVSGISMMYGEFQERIYGWRVNLSGDNFDSRVMTPGIRCKGTRRFYNDGSWDDWETLFEGIIMPGSIVADYTANGQWELTVIDILQYLGRKQSPVIVIGKRNIALNASAIADSENNAQAVSGEGEFVGEPSLVAGNAVDGSMTSLWMSQKAPQLVDDGYGFIGIPDLDYMLVNEVYPEPSVFFIKNQAQWFEIMQGNPNNSKPGDRELWLMSKEGIVLVHIDSFKYKDDWQPGFAIVCHSRNLYSRIWGGASDVPVYEFRNSWQPRNGFTEGYNWGFNLDGQGDFLAIGGYGFYEPHDRSNDRWRTTLVVDGPDMRRYDEGIFIQNPGEPVDEYHWMVSLDGTWAEDELAGCFIYARATSTSGNHCRYIKGNSATVASFGGWSNVVNLEFETAWSDWGTGEYQPNQNHACFIQAWPYHDFTNDGQGFHWTPPTEPGGNTSWGYVSSPDEGQSVRRDPAGALGGSDTWTVYDDYPTPGVNANLPNDGSVPWIMITPQPMNIVLTSPLANGATEISVNGTDGLLPSGTLYIGGFLVEYSAKTGDTITISQTGGWPGDEQPTETIVYQYDEDLGGATDLWLMKEFRIRRREIPNGSDGLRSLIHTAQLYGTTLDSPRLPGDTDWPDDWQNVAAPNNGPLFTITNNTTDPEIVWIFGNTEGDDSIRLKSVLLVIRATSDDSYARVNEIEIFPPEVLINDEFSDDDIYDLFVYLLTEMGLDPDDIQEGIFADANHGSIRPFSTDGSSYLSVLSDLAKRTGQIVWAGPRLFRVRVAWGADWPMAPAMENQMNMDADSISSAVVLQIDDHSVSQVQVRVQDNDGNTKEGYFPPEEREVGVVYRDETNYSAPLTDATIIAQWKYWTLTKDQAEISCVGPAIWMRPGVHRIDVDFPMDTDYSSRSNAHLRGTFYIHGCTHTISHGLPGQPGTKSFSTTAEIYRIPMT